MANARNEGSQSHELQPIGTGLFPMPVFVFHTSRTCADTCLYDGVAEAGVYHYSAPLLSTDLTHAPTLPHTTIVATHHPRSSSERYSLLLLTASD